MKRRILLLHGWGFNRQIWDSFIPHLEDAFRIDAIDLLGFGDYSDHSESITLESLSQHVVKNISEPCIFIGWSLGGIVALNIAIHHTEVMSHLITIASTPKFIAEEQWPGMSHTLLKQFQENLINDYQKTLHQFLHLQFQNIPPDKHLLKKLKEQINKQTRPNVKSLSDALHILQTTDLRAHLDKIQVPQHYLFGRCDTLVPQSVAHQLENLSPNVRIDVLEKVSHAPFLSAPEMCAQKIKDFLQ